MVYVDLEGTLTEGIAALYYASSAKRLDDAKKLLDHYLEEEKVILNEAKTLDQFIEVNEKSHRFHIEEGAMLLSGLSTSRLKVPIRPSKASSTIFEMGRRDKNTSIVTCTEEATAFGFCEEYKVPFYNISASGKLQRDPTGKFLTGKLERYCGAVAKANAYTGKEDVIGNSCMDLLMCKKAVEKNHIAYVANNSHSIIEQNFLDALEKFGLEHKVIS